MVEPRIVPREEHPISAPRHRSRRAEGALPPAAVRSRRVSGRRQRPRSAARPPARKTSTSARRRIPTRSRSCSGTAGSSAGASGSRTSSSGRRSIEVATFRRQVAAGRGGRAGRRAARPIRRRPKASTCIHHDNTFGTPEEDAFRRDFTINALFYDIATFSIIDYVGGLDDLRAGVVRSIGDPGRPAAAKIRCACCARSRSPRASTSRSSRRCSTRSARIVTRSRKSSPPRLLEEYYKILRAGSAEKAFRSLAEVGPAASRSRRSCTRARPSRCGDRSPRSTPTAAGSSRRPDTLIERDPARQPAGAARHLAASPAADRCDRSSRSSADGDTDATEAARAPEPRLGELPLARRDIERLRQIVSLQRRLRDLTASPKRAARARAPRHLPRSADVAGDPRRRAGAGRALEGDSRRRGRAADVPAGAGRGCTDDPPGDRGRDGAAGAAARR